MPSPHAYSPIRRMVLRSLTFGALFLASVLCVTAVVTTAAAAPPQSPVARHGWLSVQSGRIVDEHGQPAVLRGMSLYHSRNKGQFYNAEAVKWLRDDWRCEIVRAAMIPPSNRPARPGRPPLDPEAEKQKVKAVVQAANDLGIYVIIDWHGDGARNLDKAQAFFSEISKTYADVPNVIYELWNEPVRDDWSTVIKPYHEAVIAKIRANSPKSLIVCGTPTWSQDVDKAALDPVKFANVAYTLHFYAGTHRQKLRDKAAFALSKNVALMVTEWGASEATGNGKFDVDETKLWFDFMDKNALSSCNWSVADLTETSAALRPGASGRGGWKPEELNPSGAFVREWLRSKNPPPAQ